MSHFLRIQHCRLFSTLILITLTNSFSHAQAIVTGTVTDSTGSPLSFVNIGIKHKQTGTVSNTSGIFSIIIPGRLMEDTLSFSEVGFQELNLPVQKILSENKKLFQLKAHSIVLSPVSVNLTLEEKKIGLVKNHALIHFIDGSMNQADIFEIAQLVKMDSSPAKISSVNLTITNNRQDSGKFRINFYGYDGNRPTNRILEKSIVQTHAIRPGILKFDLTKYNIYVKGDFVIGIEFLPGDTLNETRIDYEVKLGGSFKSFMRSSSQGDWRVPPHHYRLFITAMVRPDVKKSKAEDGDDAESIPALRIFSMHVMDSFSIFVRLPNDYNKNKKYPAIFLLDANAYFDLVGNSLQNICKDNASPEPMLIGIGYKDFIQDDSLRNRDYTYPPALSSDSFSISGGGAKFLEFIEAELIPYIDRYYQTDPANRTLMGHSLGGYFTLYALEMELNTKNTCFRNFIAASPSLSYYNGYLLKEFRKLPTATGDGQLKRNVFITTGSKEYDETANAVQKPDIYFSFVNYLTGYQNNFIQIQSKVYPDYSHMETAVATFEDGIRWLITR